MSDSRERIIQAGNDAVIDATPPLHSRVALAAAAEAVRIVKERYRPQHMDGCPQAAQSGWLIEWYRYSTGADKQPSWWTSYPFGGTQGFSTDPNKAIRFARKEDGEKLLPLIARASASNIDWDCRVTEHLWMSDQPCSCGLDALLSEIESGPPSGQEPTR